MRPDKETSIINSVMFGGTVAAFVCLLFFEDMFTDSLWLNLQRVPIMLFGCFFIGNLIVGIPSFIYHYLTNYTFEDFYDLPKRKQRIIVVLLLLAVWIIIALVATYL